MPEVALRKRVIVVEEIFHEGGPPERNRFEEPRRSR